MSNNIDERVLQMTFENDQFESGVKDTLGSLKNLKDGLDLKGATKGLERVDASVKGVNFDGISNGIQSLTSRFSAMGIVGITILQNLTTRAMELAGQLVRTLTIQPALSGFQEYETQINAIQTILANTSTKGTTLDNVTDALQELNTYADKTIYNFTQMTRNIGTFTAAGVDLDVSVAAIKGIANLAAVSGSNSQQASTAMYQLSQALSSGTVKLMDWNSVVNAGMGGQVFQDALKETARVHGIAIDDMVEKHGSFRETLQTGWLSKDVLLETLAKFTGDLTEEELKAIGYGEEQIKAIQELGTMANDAATKVKTLTQLRETLMEAAQSGWTVSWELIIGNFDEAKAIYTRISDALGASIGKSAEARNTIIRDWRDLGGRDLIIDTVAEAMQNLLDIAEPVGKAFRDLWPKADGQKWFDWTVTFTEFLKKIKMGEDSLGNLRTIFRGLFSALDIGRLFLKDVVNYLTGFNPPDLTRVIDFLVNAGHYLTNLRLSIIQAGGFSGILSPLIDKLDALKTKIKIGFMWLKVFSEMSGFKLSFNFESIGGFLEALGQKIQPLSLIFTIFQKTLGLILVIAQKVFPFIGRIAEGAGEGLAALLDRMTTAITNFDLSNLLTALNGGLLAALLLAIRKFFSTGGDVFGSLDDVLEGLRDTLETYQNSLKSKILLSIAAAIGILAVSIALIGSVDSNRVAMSLGAITLMMVELMLAMKSLSSVAPGTGVRSSSVLIGTLLGISVALLIISSAVKRLSGIDPDGLIRALFGLGSILFMIKLVLPSLSGTAGMSVRGALALAVVAGAINILSLAIYGLGKLDPNDLMQGLSAVSAILLGLAGFTKIMSGQQGFILAAAGVYILASALLLLTAPIYLLGRMKLETLQQGLLGMALALLIISGAMYAMPKNMPITAGSLLVVSGALVVLANALKIMGSLSWEETVRGLATLAISLGLIAIALYAMSTTIPGSIALLIASGALLVMATALRQLGKMSLKEIGLALLAMAGTFLVLGVAASVLTPLLPSLFALAAALALIGLASALFGAGVLALAVGLTALATGGAAGITALVLALAAIIDLIPFTMIAIGKGLISLVTTLADGAVIIVDGIVKIASALLDGLVTLTPKVVDFVLGLLDTLLSNLAERIPSIVESGYTILLALLQGLSDNIGEVTMLVADIIVNFLDALGLKLPEIIDAGFTFMINFFDGLADAIESNTPTLIQSMAGVGKALVDGILGGFGSSLGDLIAGVQNLGNTIVSTLEGILGINSASSVTWAHAGYLAEGYTNGINHFAKKVYTTVSGFGDGVVDRYDVISDRIATFLTADMDFAPTITPVIDMREVTAGTDAINESIQGTKTDLASVFGQANDISVRMNQNGSTSSETNQDNGGSTDGNINFVQNNYSPKALSHVDLYRQTRNLVLEGKGAI